MCRERSPGTATIRREEDAHESLGLRQDGPGQAPIEQRGRPRARRPLRGARAARSRRPGAAYRRKLSSSCRLRWGRRTKGGRGRERAGAGGTCPGNGGDRASARKETAPVWQEASKDPALKGMATTLAAAVLCQRGAILTHVGDSRAYFLRDEKNRQITA